MLVVGLTGNIGSGKSLVAGIFRELGAPVYHADAESKKILGNPEVKALIVHTFGTDVLTSESQIDKKALAGLVFNDSVALGKLNSILHPKVMEDFKTWSGRQAFPYCIQEAAIIFESGIAGEFDLLIHVSCPKEIAINRVIKRDQVDGNSVLARMQFQFPDEEKSRLADHVIFNDCAHLIIPQVLKLHHLLLKIGAQGKDQVSTRTADA